LAVATTSKGIVYNHFILTRFWYSRGALFNESLTVGPETLQWLDNRLKLFEAYCLPSVTNQSCQDFKWLIYFDVKTPTTFLDRFRALVSRWSNIEVCLSHEFYVPGQVAPFNRDPPKRSEMIEDIRARLDPGAQWVMTSRLDTDDGLRSDFVERLHAAVSGPVSEFLNFPNGILYYNDQCYLYRHLSNAFISRFEPAETLATIWVGPHERLSEAGSIRQMTPQPGFLQVVHGTNASNKPRGQRVPKILALQGFEAIETLHTKPLDESNTDILLTNVFGSTRWAARDWLIAKAKSARKGLRAKA
jgi:hypothetical protein